MERLNELPHLDPLIVCNQETLFVAAEQLRQIGWDNVKILLESKALNTAPAIALAAFEAVSDGGDPILLVMPADHVVENSRSFECAVAQGAAIAETGKFVTFGVVPSRPETGYGYIKRGSKLAYGEAYIVDKFVEKPNEATASNYLEEGCYYWNSGIFMFRASHYLDELKKFRPDIFKSCQKIFATKFQDLDFIRFDEKLFFNCPEESIDYAITEHTRSSVVLPLSAGWSDIGSWSALWEVSPKMSNGNYEVGDVINIDWAGNYINAGSRLVAAVGLRDMVVVETKDAVFVAPKARASDVKHIVEQLKDEGRSEHKHHRQVHRPWGNYDAVDFGDKYQVKRITVKPGAKLSVQKHNHRAEHWVVVSGIAKVTKGEETFLLSENQSTYIPLGQIYALENPGTELLELIEVQSGSYLGEDDIVRLDDRYGRK